VARYRLATSSLDSEDGYFRPTPQKGKISVI